MSTSANVLVGHVISFRTVAISTHEPEKLLGCVLSISFEAFRSSFIFTDTSHTHDHISQWIRDNVNII